MVRPVDLLDETAVEQHAHRLDGVERHALRTAQDLDGELVRQTRHEGCEQFLHSRLRERLQEERAEVSSAGAPARRALGQLRPRQRGDENRMRARPLE